MGWGGRAREFSSKHRYRKVALVMSCRCSEIVFGSLISEEMGCASRDHVGILGGRDGMK